MGHVIVKLDSLTINVIKNVMPIATLKTEIAIKYQVRVRNAKMDIMELNAKNNVLQIALNVISIQENAYNAKINFLFLKVTVKNVQTIVLIVHVIQQQVDVRNVLKTTNMVPFAIALVLFTVR